MEVFGAELRHVQLPDSRDGGLRQQRHVDRDRLLKGRGNLGHLGRRAPSIYGTSSSALKFLTDEVELIKQILESRDIRRSRVGVVKGMEVVKWCL